MKKIHKKVGEKGFILGWGNVLIVQEHGVIDILDFCVDLVVHNLALLFHVNFVYLDLILHLLEQSLLFVG